MILDLEYIFHLNYFILYIQDQYIRDALGSPVVPKEMAPADAVSFDPQSFFVASVIFKFNSNNPPYKTLYTLGIFTSVYFWL